MRITIGGEAATGKSDTAKALARRLDLTKKSVGDFMRNLAKQRNVSIEELVKQEGTRSLDLQADNWARNVGLNEDNFVFEGRLTWMTVDHADLKVLLICGIGMRAHRRALQENISFEKARDLVLNRDEDDRKRFKTIYSDIEDFLAHSHYNCVIDTHALSIDEVVDQIVQHVSPVAVAV